MPGQKTGHRRAECGQVEGRPVNVYACAVGAAKFSIRAYPYAFTQPIFRRHSRHMRDVRKINFRRQNTLVGYISNLNLQEQVRCL
ncbi:hypothetical protein NBRC116588_25370 [Pyruvatibacter sp. HU-CL02332]